MYLPNPGPPLPPEFNEIERDYRNERRRHGSSADPFTAIVALFFIFVRLIFRAALLPVRWLLSRRKNNSPERTPEPQGQTEELSESWKRRT